MFIFHEYVAGFAAVERSDDADCFKFIHKTGSAGVSDFEPALQQRNRTLLMPDDEVCGLFKELIALR